MSTLEAASESSEAEASLMIWEAITDALDTAFLRGEGYNFWSGVGSGSPIIAGLLLFLRHRNCHVQRCWRLQWHEHPDHGHPVCRKHHPQGRRILA